MDYWRLRYSAVVKQIKNKKCCHDSDSDSLEIKSFEWNLKRICGFIYETLGSSLLEKNYQDILYEELCLFYGPKYTIKYEENIPVEYFGRFITNKRLDISIYKRQDSLQEPFIILELKSSRSEEHT